MLPLQRCEWAGPCTSGYSQINLWSQSDQTLSREHETPYRMQLLCFWTSSGILFLFKTHSFSETGFCLRLQVEPTQLGPIDRARPYFGDWIRSPSSGGTYSLGPNQQSSFLSRRLDSVSVFRWNQLTWAQSTKLVPISETGFCLRLQVEPTHLGPVDRASPYRRTGDTCNDSVIEKIVNN
jgi:hypothetical protein